MDSDCTDGVHLHRPSVYSDFLYEKYSWHSLRTVLARRQAKSFCCCTEARTRRDNLLPRRPGESHRIAVDICPTSGSALPSQEGVKVSFSTSTGLQADLTIKGDASEITKIQTGGPLMSQHFRKMQDVYRDHFLYQRGVLDDVILNIIATASDRPISERADSALVRKYLRAQLDTLGIDAPFEYAVVNRSGVVQYRSEGFRQDSDKESAFSQTLFPRDPSSQLYFLKVYFPTMKDFIFKSISFMVRLLPSLSYC